MNASPKNDDTTSNDGISVIIPAYNATPTLQRCIESVLNTKYSPLEIIVADDASTDGTVDLVTDLAKANPDQVRLIKLDSNGGPARARNAGAEAAQFPYFFSWIVIRKFCPMPLSVL